MREPGKPVAYIEMEDFLALEHASRHKHEYLCGVIYAIQGQAVRGMAGGAVRLCGWGISSSAMSGLWRCWRPGWWYATLL